MDLESLSSHELHDMAVRRALHHADVKFLWELLRVIPAAEASEGEIGESEADATKVSALLADAVNRHTPRALLECVRAPCGMVVAAFLLFR